MKTNSAASQEASHQTVPLKVETAAGPKSIQMSFTNQKLTAHGGLALMSSFLERIGWRRLLERALPHRPTSPNAYAPVDIALGFMGGVWAGADKFSRVGQLCGDPALPEILGIEAVPSQPTLTRFFRGFDPGSNINAMGQLYRRLLGWLPGRREGYTLDIDSTSILHEDGHQEGVCTGYTPRGPKPCHQPLIAALAEVPLVCGYWLRSGNTVACSNAVAFLDDTLSHCPAHVRIGLVRADSGFYHEALLTRLEERRLDYIIVARLTRPVKALCRHDDSCWMPTGVPGIEVQEIDVSPQHGQARRRLIVVRQRIDQRPNAGGKTLLDVPGYRYQVLCTSLPPSWTPLAIWRRYNGRADVENRIKELATQFGLKSFCSHSFWGTEAAGHLVIAAHNLVILFQRHLGLLERVQVSTLRYRLFTRAAVFSHPARRPTLKFSIPKNQRDWWRCLLDKLNSTLPPFNCNSVGSLRA